MPPSLKHYIHTFRTNQEKIINVLSNLISNNSEEFFVTIEVLARHELEFEYDVLYVYHNNFSFRKKIISKISISASFIRREGEEEKYLTTLANHTILLNKILNTPLKKLPLIIFDPTYEYFPKLIKHLMSGTSLDFLEEPLDTVIFS